MKKKCVIKSSDDGKRFFPEFLATYRDNKREEVIKLIAHPYGNWAEPYVNKKMIQLKGDHNGNFEIKIKDKESFTLNLSELSDLVTAARMLHKFAGSNVFCKQKHTKIKKVK